MKDMLNNKKVFGGMRATGRLHLGNYLGGAKGMIELQDKYDCIFFIADLHVLTTPYDPKKLRESVRNVVLDYLGVGLDPKKCAIEIQSQIPEHTELAYLISTVYSLAPLQDLPTFKEKIAQYPKSVTVALLYYPILMAADILLFKGELVPVGLDQEPHLEVARDIARKFNNQYGYTFPEPIRFATKGQYVPSISGKGKMSKSVEGSFISLGDSLEIIRKKLASAPTDSGIIGGSIPSTGGVANLFQLFSLFNNGVLYKKYEEDYKNGRIRYSEMKNNLAELIFKEIEPVQKRREYYENNPKLVDNIINEGRKKCLSIAKKTILEVKEKMGLL